MSGRATEQQRFGNIDMTADWYRNTTWSPAIEQAFESKLKRARRKSEYLLLQANALVRAHPDVSLRLLDRSIELGDDTFTAEAHEIRARALLALERVDEAIDAYEATLRREGEFPNVQTNSVFHFPLLIATRSLRQLYPRALELVSLAEMDASLMSFPAARFDCYAARSLILADSGDLEGARVAAATAIAAAAQRHSGYRYHPDVGLVGDGASAILEKLYLLVGKNAEPSVGADSR